MEGARRRPPMLVRSPLWPLAVGTRRGLVGSGGDLRHRRPETGDTGDWRHRRCAGASALNADACRPQVSPVRPHARISSCDSKIGPWRRSQVMDLSRPQVLRSSLRSMVRRRRSPRQSFVVPRITSRSALKMQSTPEHRYCKSILPHSRVLSLSRSASMESGRQLVTW